MSLISFFYLFGCLSLPYFGDKVPRKLLFVIGLFGLSICMLIMGPSKVFNFPVNKMFVLIGYPLTGICQTLLYLPILPEMIERLQVDLNIKDGENEALDDKLNDFVNQAYCLIYASTAFLAPMLGSILHNIFG